MSRWRRALDWAHSLPALVATELLASVVGFGVMILLARRLGPSGFADFEYASAVAAWWLVAVRGGFDSIVYREAARRPRLVGPLSGVLIGLRLASALVALAAVMALAWASGPIRGPVVAVAGLVLVPSALASDVGPRASGRFGGLVLAQSTRTLGLALGVVLIAKNPALTAGCVVAAEAASTAVLLALHRSEHGAIRPRFRRPAWSAVARRGAVAGATRFARVSLYAADVLILGAVATSGLGPYAAARRVAFALLAVGLVVPSAVAPRIARAWASGGAAEARSAIARAFEGLSVAALPATVGLMATADRWMPRLFGEGFREGGPWLALVAARLPFVLASNVQQVALISCRREGWSLALMASLAALGLVALPPLAIWQGPWGVGLGVLGVEVAGAFAGWLALRRLGIAPSWHHASGPAAIGCVGLALTCRLGRDWPLGGMVIAAAGVYGLILLIVSRRDAGAPSSSPLPLGEGPGVRGVRSTKGVPSPGPNSNGHHPHPRPLSQGERGGRGVAAGLTGSFAGGPTP